MIHKATLLRSAALLIAAAALPLPLAAQETQPPADPPASQSAPAPAETPTPVPEPAADATPPAATAAPASAPSAPAAAAPARETRRVVRTTTVSRAPAAPAVIAPAPAAPAATIPSMPADSAALPPVDGTAMTPEVLPAAPPAAVAPPPAVREEPRNPSMLPWLLLAFALAGGLAFLLLRRRRPAAEVYHEEERVEAAPVAAAPVVAAPVAAAPAAASGAPRIELMMRPIRAGVTGEGARVEFELTVDNRGSAAARDVRVSTWMLASDASEAERALIEPADHADAPPVTIDAGEARKIQASVALPTAEVEGDALLPVVVADARYRREDGMEHRTTASFAVGVPDGEELAHFDVEHPSGLHEGVEARPWGGRARW